MKNLSQKQKKMFAEGAKMFSNDRDYKTPIEWEEKGIENLIRKSLGLFRKQRVKSLNEFSKILIDLKIANSENQGNKFIKDLYGKKIETSRRIIEFSKVENKYREACRINLSYYTYDPIVF